MPAVRGADRRCPVDSINIAPMQETDWPAVVRIYGEGIATAHATFAEFPPESWALWSAGKAANCSLIARSAEGVVVGWAALARTSARPVYRGVGEVSIYVAAHTRGSGVGRTLLTALVSVSEEQGFWTLTAGIFPENRASLHLHAACGFRVVGTHAKMGIMSYGPMAGRWRDVRLLERRSQVVGLEETVDQS